MTTINWYDVLLVESDCTTVDIKNAYRRLVQIYHPDKPDGDAEMFGLVTHAYNVLINPQSRSSYDKLYNISKQSETDHMELRNKSKEYFNSLESVNSKKPKEEADIDFDKIFAEMDVKYGLKRDTNKNLVHKDAADIKKKADDLESIREQDDIENIPDKLFNDDEQIDLQKFNNMFNAMHKKQTDLIKHDGNPLAWNTLSEHGSFSSIDNYEALFVEDDDLGNSLFGSVKASDSNVAKKISKKELEKHMNNTEYSKPHNYKDENNAKTLEEKMEEIKRENERYKNRDMSDFNDDNNCGGYGIYSGIGIDFEEYKEGGLLEDGEDLKRKYSKMLEIRKK